MTQKKEQVNLLEKVGNKCLEQALMLLNEKTALNADKIKAVSDLVGIAISIDALNLRWAEQNRYGGAVFQGQLLEQTTEEN